MQTSAAPGENEQHCCALTSRLLRLVVSRIVAPANMVGALFLAKSTSRWSAQLCRAGRLSTRQNLHEQVCYRFLTLRKSLPWPINCVGRSSTWFFVFRHCCGVKVQHGQLARAAAPCHAAHVRFDGLLCSLWKVSVVRPVASQASAKNPWPDNVMGHGTGFGRPRVSATLQRSPASCAFSLADFDAARAARVSNSRVVLAEEKELEHRQFLNEIAVV